MKREKLRRFSTHKSCILSYPFNIGMKNSFWFLTWRWFSSLWAEERAEMKSSFCEIFAQRVEMHIKLIPNGYYSLQHDNIRYYIGIGREHLQHKSNIWHNFVTQDVFDNFPHSSFFTYCYAIRIVAREWELSGFSTTPLTVEWTFWFQWDTFCAYRGRDLYVQQAEKSKLRQFRV